MKYIFFFNGGAFSLCFGIAFLPTTFGLGFALPRFIHFHRIGPMGRFSLVVVKVVCLCLCPLPMKFFSVDRFCIFAWTESAF